MRAGAVIGVFDSGHGGLTILRSLRAHFPQHRFVYFGDHAAAPYGDRSADDIYALTRQGVTRLFEHGARLVILACNTASAVALRRMQRTWLADAYPDRRVLGVLVPMVEAITGVPWMLDQPPKPAHLPKASATVAIFATPRTVESMAYPYEIGLRAPQARVVQQACPDLARLIESDARGDVLSQAIQGYAASLMRTLAGKPPDIVVLGCTHYPLAMEHFIRWLPPGTSILSQPELTARSLAAYLERHQEFALLHDDVAEPGGIAFLTTGDPIRLSPLASRFFGSPIEFIASAAPAER
jgi:glutamate racemase